jgi:hypothetical protein
VSQERQEKERNFVWVEIEVTTVRVVWVVSQIGKEKRAWSWCDHRKKMFGV